MKIEENWNEKYQLIIDYMLANKRRPSKHRAEDHPMLNWIKYNKKMKVRGKMSAERAEKFEQLLAIADKYRKLNQNAYARSSEEMELF